MITRAQITRRADDDGVSAKVVERDYVLAHAVALIASHDTESKLIFKGGTSLRLIHFAKYRYSADLDYSVVSGSVDQAVDLIRSALEENEVESIAELELGEGDPPRILYRGPLGRQRKLKLDLAADELVIRTERKPLLPLWPDLPQVSVAVYTPAEVAGEKLRCVMQRLQCRDLFDLDVLFADLEVDPVEAAELFSRKAVHRGLEPKSFAEKFQERVVEYERRWEAELSEHLVGEVPHFGEVDRRIRRVLRQAAIL